MKRYISGVMLALAVMAGAATPFYLGRSTVHAVADCEYATVNAAIAAAVDGDTVLVPAGACSWSSQLFPGDKAITIQGAGIDQTTITITSGAANGAIQWYFNKPTGELRWTGFTIDDGSGSAENSDTTGTFIIAGTAANFRFDHNKIIQNRQNGVLSNGYIRGVVDHNIFDSRIFGHSWIPLAGNWEDVQGCTGYSQGCGDRSWARPSTQGTSEALYFEDNTFKSTGDPGWNGSNNPGNYATNAQNGARTVYRFNTFENSVWADHGTETGGRVRSERHSEIYGNNITLSNLHLFGGSWQSFAGIRGGTSMIFDNVASTTNGVGLQKLINLTNFRAGDLDRVSQYYPFAMCGEQSLTGITQSGGTASASGFGLRNDQSVEIIGASPSAYNGVKTVLTPFNNAGSPWTFAIASGTSSPASGTIKIRSPFDGNSDSSGYPCLDQPGRGQGDLLVGDLPTGAWPNQALEPIYILNNCIGGTLSGTDGACSSGLSAASATSDNGTVQANRDYYNQSTSFNGTSGIGRGPIASRPSSCTPGPGGARGVGYWATDEADWNHATGHDGPDGQLYACTGSGTWTLIYTPYDYPHPLISGATSGSNPSLAITTPNSAGYSEQTTSTLSSLAGTCSDDSACVAPTWSNDGGGSGTATGTSSWSISNIALALGLNTITVNADDDEANAATPVTHSVFYLPNPSTAVDDFSHDNSHGLGPQWTSLTGGAPYTRSGGAATNSASTFGCAKWIAQSPSGANQSVRIVIGSTTVGSGYVRAAVHMTGTSQATLGAIVFSTDGKTGGGTFSTHLGEFVGGSFSSLQDIAETFSVGDELRIDYIDDFITLYHNSIAIGSPIAYSGTNTTGVYGACLTGPASINSFEAQEAAASGDPPVVLPKVRLRFK